jgi:hypothetical protein
LRAGRSLEVLVSHLERVLAGDSVKVTSPMKLRDRFTSGLREHDVVLTIDQGHHQLLVAIECRDHSRPISVSQVEAFHTKCQDTGVAQGIIVSSKGFYHKAQKKAQQLGIRSFTLQEAVAFDWLLAPGMQVRKRRPTHLSLTMSVKQGTILSASAMCDVVDSQGTPVPMDLLQAEVLEQFRSVPWESSADTGECSLELEPLGLFIRANTTDAALPIEKIVCSLKYETVRVLAPFKLVRYVDEDKEKKITQAAVIDGSGHGLPGDIVIAYDPDEGGGVYLVKRSSDKPRNGEEP